MVCFFFFLISQTRLGDRRRARAECRSGWNLRKSRVRKSLLFCIFFLPCSFFFHVGINPRIKVGVHITPQMVRLLYTSLHCGYLWRYMRLACNSWSAECWAQLSYAATFGVNSRVGPGAYGMKARYLYLYYRKCPPCRIWSQSCI